MSAFVESAGKQHNLPAMPRSQRRVVHQMAQAFGLATQSLGQEPNRALRLLKVGFLSTAVAPSCVQGALVERCVR